MPAIRPDKNKRPEKLGPKLLDIRLRLRESQNGILRLLGLNDIFGREYVSKWERGALEPPLHVLCAYADAANVYVEVLIKDELELPLDLPAPRKSMGLVIDKKS